MTTYYMTGDSVHAWEVVRPAFPDARTKEMFFEIDGHSSRTKTLL